MNVVDVLNRLLAESRGKNFCGIAYTGNTDFFDRVSARRKVCVNPHLPQGEYTSNIASGDYYHGTAEEYFANRSDGPFDVVFICRVRDSSVVLSTVEAALSVLADDGYVVVTDCIPSSAISQLSQAEFRAERAQAIAEGREFGTKWMGDVWKTVVRLLQTRHDLDIFTLDVRGGATVISRGVREALPSFDFPSYEEFAKNPELYLNLQDERWFYEFILRHRGQRVPHMYTETPLASLAHFALNRKLDNDVVAVAYEDATILPLRGNGRTSPLKGGVVDSAGKFVAGALRRQEHSSGSQSVAGAYPFSPDDVATSSESVVFAGCLYRHFGHMLVDGMYRFWWFAQNPHYDGQVALIWRNDEAAAYYKLFEWLGVDRSRLVTIDKPTRFANVIVPDQASYSLEGYCEHYLDAFEAIKRRITPANCDRVYLTRRHLDDVDTVNEEYFENHFARQGYQIVAPERLPLEEQIAIVSGAKAIACVSGTLEHLVLFARTGAKVTILRRTTETVPPVALLARNADVTYIDVSMNFLPTRHVHGSYLLLTTPQWKHYLADNSIPMDEGLDIKDYALEYIQLWVKNYQRRPALRHIRRANMLDLVDTLSKYVLGEDIDRRPLAKLFASK
jgi:hypothetical protein